MRAQISDEIVTWSVPALVTACFLHLRRRMVLCLALSPLLLSGNCMVYVGRFASVLLMVLGCTPALAQSVSPDGSVISNGTGTLTNAAGTWSFGGPARGRPGEWLILLNGSASNGGVSAALEVANGGQIYALTAAGSWWIWQNGSWTPTSAPAAVSPDGSIISNGTGSLRTAAGTWSFGGPAPGRPGEWLILLNGSASNGGISAALEVANGGQIYALTAAGSWWIWQNGSWTPTSAPSASPTATLTLTFNPQMPSIPENTPLGTVVATATAAWSDGSPFTGTIMFTPPYSDDGGTFALSCMRCTTANIVINPVGLGVMGDGGSVQYVT